jgi:hypothetical protein
MNDETEQQQFWSMRILNEESSFESRVFWSVNVILITFMMFVFVWCVCGGGAVRTSNYLSSGSSDVVFSEQIRQRRDEEGKREPPEERRKKLIESFHRNKVYMVRRKNVFFVVILYAYHLV